MSEFDNDLFASIQNTITRCVDEGTKKYLKTDLSNHKNFINIPLIKHDILIKNETMYLEPPLEETQRLFIQNFQNHLSKICNLPKITSLRLDSKNATNQNFNYEPKNDNADLLLNIKDIVSNAYCMISKKIKHVNLYVQKWLQYQTLLDLEHDKVCSSLGDDLNRWLQKIIEIKEFRSIFDTSETRKYFGHIIIDYENVQFKVNSKHDLWQKDILKEFSSRLGNKMNVFYNNINLSRIKSETFSIENSSISSMMDFMRFLQELKNKLGNWEKDVELFLSCQKTIESERFSLPDNWIYPEQIKSEWSSFNQTLNYKYNRIMEKIDDLRLKIKEQEKNLNAKASSVLEDWANNKPIKGNIKHDIAINTLSDFQNKTSALSHEISQMEKTKTALNLHVQHIDRVDIIIEEIKDFKLVWESLSDIWKSMYDLYKINWTMVEPRKIR